MSERADATKPTKPAQQPFYFSVSSETVVAHLAWTVSPSSHSRSVVRILLSIFKFFTKPIFNHEGNRTRSSRSVRKPNRSQGNIIANICTSFFDAASRWPLRCRPLSLKHGGVREPVAVRRLRRFQFSTSIPDAVDPSFCPLCFLVFFFIAAIRYAFFVNFFPTGTLASRF